MRAYIITSYNIAIVVILDIIGSYFLGADILAANIVASDIMDADIIASYIVASDIMCVDYRRHSQVTCWVSRA